MPNMDDISFGDSTPYTHRGGLWSDAARTEKPVATLEEARVSLATGASEEKDPTSPPLILRTDSLVTETLPPDALPMVQLEPATASSDTSPHPTSRQSWAGVQVSDQENATPGEDTDSSRGRRSRASSSVQREDGSVTPSANTASDDEHDIFRYLSPQYSARSSSTHSQAHSSRTHSIFSSDDCTTPSDSTSRRPRHKGPQEEISDAGPTYQRARTESTHNRPSYADVRAAMNARREQHSQPEAESNGLLPIPIPQTGSPRSSGRPGSSSVGSSTGKSSERHPILSRSPGMTLSRSGGDKTGDPLYDRNFRDDLDDHPGSSPIHTQPSQARTMTIPGIHASHRGEIMSMGNIAASPPSPENRAKATTIQSVYRLWKSPTLSGQQESQTSERDNDDVTPLVLSSESTPLPSKPVPPPLPPRTVSVPPERRDPADDEVLPSSDDRENKKPPLPPRRTHA